MAFFQFALLLGYAYAHLLQRLGPVRRQMTAHLVVLALAALVLPLHVPDVFGTSSIDHPILWLLGVLALAIGPPFAALSATAPLLQAWFGRMAAGPDASSDPYALYAASNLGSLLALLAYPFIVQPLTGLGEQRIAWSSAYGVFVLLILALVALLWRRPDAVGAARPGVRRVCRLRRRLDLEAATGLDAAGRRAGEPAAGRHHPHHHRCGLRAVPLGSAARALSSDLRHRLPVAVAGPAGPRSAAAGHIGGHLPDDHADP